MGKYKSSVVKQESTGQRGSVHVAWRGIGCLMMLIIPVISIAAGVMTIDYGIANKWPIPYELLGMPRFPDWFYSSTGIMTLISPIANIKHLYAYAATSFLYAIVLSGIMSMLYAFVYRMIGPSQYGPLDMPPPNFKIKKYKR